jgi:superfamily II DNA/RNA helicase
MSSFRSLGVPAGITDALDARGVTEAFPIQALTLPDSLAGRDVAGKAKTGSGKTLAFGIPMLVRSTKGATRRPTALALAPTRELAAQICTELTPLGRAVDRRVGVVYGGASMETQVAELQRGVDVLIATPGRLIDLIERGEVALDDVAIIAIDEADRMADLGFLPQVDWVLRHVPETAQTMLFSATLDGAVASLARRLKDPAIHGVEDREPTVESMTHRFVQIHHRDKAAVVARIVGTEDRAIVFCRTKRGCDRLVDDLVDLGVPASAIHGDLAQNQRERALRAFSDGSRPVLVATDVAARGIHIDEVSVVVHFNPPEDHTTYLHRSGRTARAGADGLVVTLIEWDEELVVRRIQRRLGLGDIPQVEMFSNDPRLADLANWDPTVAA